MKSYAVLYFGIVAAALVAGLVVPDIFAPFAPFSTQILGAIFFITALQLNLKNILQHAKHVKVVLFSTVWLLIAFPIVVYAVAHYLVPDQALALLLLAAMPAGMTAPLLTKVAGGAEEFSLVLAVVTSLFAPITVPLIIFLMVGSSVAVDVVAIATSLVYIIFIPFILGGLIKHFWPAVEGWSQKLSTLSLVLLGVLIAGLVSQQAGLIVEQIASGAVVVPLIVLFSFFIVAHVLGYAVTFRGRKSLQVASIVSLVYMNFTLAIYLANTFFPDPQVVVPTTLSIVPWALLLAPFAFVYTKLLK